MGMEGMELEIDLDGKQSMGVADNVKVVAFLACPGHRERLAGMACLDALGHPEHPDSMAHCRPFVKR